MEMTNITMDANYSMGLFLHGQTFEIDCPINFYPKNKKEEEGEELAKIIILQTYNRIYNSHLQMCKSNSHFH